MQVTIELPEDVAAALGSGEQGGVPRRVLETFALEGYRSGELARAQVRRLPGFEHRVDVDAFLKEQDVPLSTALDDLERGRETPRTPGLR